MNRKLFWTLALDLNLIVPVLMAFSFVSGWGWVGVAVAVVALWLAGLDLCDKAPTIVARLVWGGALVGLAQLFPLIQIFAGLLAVGITDSLGGVKGASDQPWRQVITGPTGGFLATALTGGVLLAVALVFGCALEWLRRRGWIHGRRAAVVSPLFDRELDG